MTRTVKSTWLFGVPAQAFGIYCPVILPAVTSPPNGAQTRTLRYQVTMTAMGKAISASGGKATGPGTSYQADHRELMQRFNGVRQETYRFQQSQES